MRQAIWKALMIQRNRYRVLKEQLGTAEKVKREMASLRKIETLFREMFPEGSIDPSQLEVLRGVFRSEISSQMKKMAMMKEPFFKLE